jgi:hypothetical protein
MTNEVVKKGAKEGVKKLPVVLAAIAAFLGVKGLSKNKETEAVVEVAPQEKVLTPEEIAEKQAAILKAKQESAAHPDARCASIVFDRNSYDKKYYPIKSKSDDELVTSPKGYPWHEFESVEVKYGLYNDMLTSIELVTMVNKDGSCIKIINGEGGKATAKYIDKEGVEYDIPVLNFKKLEELNEKLSSCKKTKKRERIIKKYQEDANRYKYSYGLGDDNTTENWMISTGDPGTCLRKNSIKQTTSSSSSSSSSSSCPEADALRREAAEYRRLAKEYNGSLSGIPMDQDEDAHSYFMSLADSCERRARAIEHSEEVYRTNPELWYKMY